MSAFQQQALVLAEQQNTPAFLATVRAQGAEQWARAAWPDRRAEHWKYTPLRSLQRQLLPQWGAAESLPLSELPIMDHPTAVRLVFVNGQFAAELSSSHWPEGLTLFSQADAVQQAVIAQHLGRYVDTDRHLFAALSNAWVDEGVLLHIPARQQLRAPIYVVHVSTPQADPTAASQRLLVVLESEAQATLIEHFVSTTAQQNGFVNSLTELGLSAGSHLNHTRIHLEQEHLSHIGGVHGDLGRDAQLNAFTLAQGSVLKRLDYHLRHRGAGSFIRFNGVYLPYGRQLIDYHTNVEHCEPHGTTEQMFRGIIGDAARAVFNGRIHIHPDAQKTLAEMNNRNLLLTDRAEVDTKPELEIYADDVRCAHGATITKPDATALYYLRSRGVSKSVAEAMLYSGFVNELIAQLPDAATQSWLQEQLPQLLARLIQSPGAVS